MKIAEIVSHTGLRGFAAFCVIMYHYRSILTPAINVDDYTQFFSMSGAFVDLFFILSGFIIAANYQHLFSTNISLGDAFRFLRNRIARVYPLHLATLLLMVVLLFARDDGRSVFLAAKWDILAQTFLIHAWGIQEQYRFNFPSWSISAEWMLYLLFPFLTLGLQRKYIKVAILLVAFLSYVILFTMFDGFELNERLSLLRAIPAFILGMSLFQYRAAQPNFGPFGLALLQGLSLLCATLVMHSSYFDFLLVPAFSAIVLLTWRDKGPIAFLFSRAPFRLLGVISYSIYMLHIPVQRMTTLLWWKFFPVADFAPETNAILLTVLCVIVTIAAGTASYHWFEKPVRRVIIGRRGPLKI